MNDLAERLARLETLLDEVDALGALRPLLSGAGSLSAAMGGAPMVQNYAQPGFVPMQFGTPMPPMRPPMLLVPVSPLPENSVPPPVASSRGMQQHLWTPLGSERGISLEQAVQFERSGTPMMPLRPARQQTPALLTSRQQPPVTGHSMMLGAQRGIATPQLPFPPAIAFAHWEPLQSSRSSVAPPQSGRSSLAPPQSGRASVAHPQSGRVSVAFPQSGRVSVAPPQSSRSSAAPLQSCGISVAPPQSGRNSVAPPQDTARVHSPTPGLSSGFRSLSPRSSRRGPLNVENMSSWAAGLAAEAAAQLVGTSAVGYPSSVAVSSRAPEAVDMAPRLMSNRWRDPGNANVEKTQAWTVDLTSAATPVPQATPGGPLDLAARSGDPPQMVHMASQLAAEIQTGCEKLEKMREIYATWPREQSGAGEVHATWLREKSG